MKMIRGLAREDKSVQLKVFLRACVEVGADVEEVKRCIEIVSEDTRRTRGNESKAEKGYLANWYRSVELGAPDFDRYSGEHYLAESWICWLIYSRVYLAILSRINVLPPTGLLPKFGSVRHVVDLGCGIGFSTLALRELFPNAAVEATNLEGTLQSEVCAKVGVDVTENLHTLQRPADVVFASEYFEHFQRPIDHLDYMLDTLSPRVLLVANSFGAIAVGHFPTYGIGSEEVVGRAAGRKFNDALRGRGYEMIRHGAWNNRPNVWRLG